MKIAILGSRSISNCDNIGDIVSPDADEIVSGGAKGADSIGEKIARERGLKLAVAESNT